jgi:hypothetical protein
MKRGSLSGSTKVLENQGIPTPGSRVRLTGGYDDPPEYLAGRQDLYATIEGAIAGTPILRLDDPVMRNGRPHAFALVRRRLAEAHWVSGTVVEIAVYERPPSTAADFEVHRVELHAELHIIRSLWSRLTSAWSRVTPNAGSDQGHEQP